MDSFDIDSFDFGKGPDKAKAFVAQQTLDQVKTICGKEITHLQYGPTFEGFEGVARDGSQGMLSLKASVSNDQEEIHLLIELANVGDRTRVSVASFVSQMAELGKKTDLLSKPGSKPNCQGIWARMRIQAEPVSLVRANNISEELNKINKLSLEVQRELPVFATNADLAKRYSSFEGVLQPVLPAEHTLPGGLTELNQLVKDACNCLRSSLNIAIVSSEKVISDYFLAHLSAELIGEGRSLARVSAHGVNPKGLLEIAGKSPGIVTMPALSLKMTGNPYNLNSDIETLLQSLQGECTPVVFTGSYNQLQSVFHGGQGATQNALIPVIFRLPALEVEPLVNYKVDEFGQKIGGFTAGEKSQIIDYILSLLDGREQTEKIHLLEHISSWTVQSWNLPESVTQDRGKAVLAYLSARGETFSAFSDINRAERPPVIESRFTSALGGNKLRDYLGNRLLGQDEALDALCERLRMEALTRPSWQPLRYCAQGTPGTGKSESAKLLAELLGVPFVNIDAASMPDYHTAASQLLGSGRGIVMSFQAGRLEEAAKHHQGAVVEISDLDHANPAVRSFLADLFLQLLETGEAQSATGAMFSCSNLIFAFTMNLPDGADEKVHHSLGFANSPSTSEVRRRVIGEIKNMLSSAFLSRVGSPIIFKPLEEGSMGRILEGTIEKAVNTAVRRFGVNGCDLEIERGLGAKMLKSFENRQLTFGARAILEYGRGMAARLVSRWFESKPAAENGKLVISFSDSAEAKMEIRTEENIHVEESI